MEANWQIEISPRLLAPAHQLPAFYTEPWLHHYQETFDAEILYIHLLKGNSFLGVTPVHYKKKPIPKAFSPYQSPLGALMPFENSHRVRWSENRRVQRILLDNFLKLVHKKFPYLQLGPGEFDYDILRENQWDYIPQPHLTCIYSQFSDEHLEKRTLRTLRKASDLGYQVEKTLETKKFKEAFENTYLSKGLPLPYSSLRMHHYHQKILQSGLAEAWVVKDAKGQDEGYMSVIPYPQQNQIIAWQSGGIPNANKFGAITLLWKHVLDYYRNQSQSILWGGTCSPSLGFFKEQFANKELPFGTISKYNYLATKALYSSLTYCNQSFRKLIHPAESNFSKETNELE